jgi:hypothetical protein
MISENPLVEGSGLFVLHTRKPRMLIKVLDFDSDDEIAIMEEKKQISIGGSLEYGDKYFLFSLVEVYDEIDNEAQKTANDLAKLMRRAADWFEAYLKFEDKNYDS